jgi:hypothetical protein
MQCGEVKWTDETCRQVAMELQTVCVADLMTTFGIQRDVVTCGSIHIASAVPGTYFTPDLVIREVFAINDTITYLPLRDTPLLP